MVFSARKKKQKKTPKNKKPGTHCRCCAVFALRAKVRRTALASYLMLLDSLHTGLLSPAVVTPLFLQLRHHRRKSPQHPTLLSRLCLVTRIPTPELPKEFPHCKRTNGSSNLSYSLSLSSCSFGPQFFHS